MKRGLRVVLVDAREVSRRGLHQMLGDIPFVRALKVVDSPAGASFSKSDVVIMTSDLSEREVSEILRHSSPDARFVLIIRSAIPDWAVHVPRRSLIEEAELTQAILIDSLRGEPEPLPDPRGILNQKLLGNSPTLWWPRLTPRETQTLALLAEGMTNRQIAISLSISVHGAKRLVANVLAKLNSPNRTTAVARAIREGLIPPQAGEAGARVRGVGHS